MENVENVEQPAIDNAENLNASEGTNNAENPSSPLVVLQNGAPIVRRRPKRAPLGEIRGSRRPPALVEDQVPKRHGEDEGVYFKKRVRVVLPDGRSFNIRYRVHQVDE